MIGWGVLLQLVAAAAVLGKFTGDWCVPVLHAPPQDSDPTSSPAWTTAHHDN